MVPSYPKQWRILAAEDDIHPAGIDALEGT
jgi:hypothetical protein